VFFRLTLNERDSCTSLGKHVLIAEKYLDKELFIHKLDKFNDLKNYYDTRRKEHSQRK
jgi:hypothetical protein